MAVWDHRTGNYPGGFACAFRYPADEGIARGGSIYTTRMFPAPESFRTGEAFRALVQIFPDGSCGYAVNGNPVGITRQL
jgi:hypothetical protein